MLRTKRRSASRQRDAADERHGEDVQPTEGLPAIVPRAVPSKSEGLCFDCENRPQCVMRVVEGGIWHCEEYQ